MRSCTLALLAFSLSALDCSLCQVASADTITASRTGSALICLGPPSLTGGAACDITYSNVNVATGLAELSGTYGSTSAGAVMTAIALGDASYGVLRSSAFASFDVSGTSKPAFAFGEAYFQDVITVNFAPWTGLPGLMYVNYNLDGTVSSSNAHAFSQVSVVAGDDYQHFNQTFTSSSAGKFGLPGAIHFVYGQPFELSFLLYTAAGTAVPYGNNGGFLFGSEAGNGSANANFFDTLFLSNLLPTDLNGDDALGATFSSASGTYYSIDGVIPEPSSLGLLLLTGAFVFILTTCKKASTCLRTGHN